MLRESIPLLTTMAHFALLWKARTIEKYRLNYETEKINSILKSHTQIPKQSLSQRWRHYRCDTQKRISRTFKRWYPEGSSLSNLYLYLKTDQTFPNFVLKSVLGFVGGIVLTYLCFMFFVFQLSISLIHATMMSSIIGVLLTLGLAFSYRIRCLVFLLIPQFFSRVGRYTLTCYALVLILTGPATNTLKNSEVLSESLACGQEQIKTTVSHISTLKTKPLNCLKDSIKLMLDRLKEIAVKVKSMILKINRLILSVAQVIQTGHLWLNSISITRNEKLGTPYQRCMHALQDGIQSCKNTFGSNESTLCNKSHSMKNFCINIKSDSVYTFVEHLNGNMVPIINKRLKNFSERIQHMFYMQVHVHHSYSFSSNSSHTASQVAAGIVTEIRKRADPLLTWLSWSSCVTSLFLLLIIFRAKYYQYMFETRSRFDNRYITKEIRNLDLKRLREGRQTILPLNRRERAKYVTTTSFRLVASEKVYLNRSVVFMSVTTFKLLVHMVADYSLYWVLMTIRYHGRLQTPVNPEATENGIHISGSGPIADLLKSIVVSLGVLMETPAMSPVSCLPNPYPPDFRRYKQIGVLIFLLWFFAMFEPYGLRLRHVVMGHYQPERAKTRAVWLYNHILRTRGGFMKFARRKLHRTYKYRTEERLTFSRWLDNHIPFCWIRSCLGTNLIEPRCLLCGISYDKPKPDTQLIRCKSASCPGLYCTSCFMDIGELCTICLSPEDYGDMSDVSLEKETSSDDSDDNNNDTVPNYSICEAGESNASTSNEVSRRSKRNMLSKSKTDCLEMKPLISRRNYKLGDLGNCNDTLNLRGHLGTAHMKASLVRHKKKYYDGNQSEKHKEDTAILCQYCDNKHYDHCSFNMQRKDNSINYLSEVMRRVDNECMQIQMHQYNKKIVKQVNGKQYNKFTKMHKINHSENNVKFLTYKIPRSSRLNIASYTLKSTARSTKFSSHCNFYRVTLSQNTIYVHKIIKPTKLAMAVEKHLKAIYKCKMKRNSRTKNGSTRRVRDVVETCGSKHSVNQRSFPACITPYSCSCGHKSDINNADLNKRNNSKADIHDNFSKKSSKSDASSFYRYQRLKLLFSDFWKNMSSNMNFDVHKRSSTAKNNNTVSKVMKNHKRRKKKNRKDNGHDAPSDDVQVGSDQNDSDDNRRYRISAFLSDQEWIKRHFKKVVRIRTGLNNECGDGTIESSEELADIKPLPSCQQMNGTQRNNNIQHATQVNNNMHHNNGNTYTEALSKKNEDIQLCNKGTEVQTNENEDIPPSGNEETEDEDIEPHVEITNKVSNRGLTVMTDVCKKLACDLITFTSSNSYMEKIANQRRKRNKKETATTYPPAIERYLDFYESIGHEDFVKLCCAEEDKNAEIDTMQGYGVSEEFDSRDPYIAFSDVSSSARKLYFMQYNQNLKNAASRFKSDLSERLANGLKNSLSLCRNFCYGGCPVGVCSVDKLNVDSSHNIAKPDEDEAKDKSRNKEAKELYKKNEDNSQLYIEQIEIMSKSDDENLDETSPIRLTADKELEDVPTESCKEKLELDIIAPVSLTADKQVEILPTKSQNEEPGVMDTTAKHPFEVYQNINKPTSTKKIQTDKLQEKKPACDKVTKCKTTCSCATQYSSGSSDMKLLKQMINNPDDRLQTTIYEFSSTSCSGGQSSSISLNETTCSDPTICSLAYMKQTPSVVEKVKRCQIESKSDKTTYTDWPKYCHVSTTTKDWWSPIVDRRRPKKVSYVDDAIDIEKERREKAQSIKTVKAMGQANQTAVRADGKIVTIQSQAQIIPTLSTIDPYKFVDDSNVRDCGDYTLTASRYLLESQRYYNELYHGKYYSPHLFAVHLPQKYSGHSSNQRHRHVTGTHHNNRRKYKTKRLEECYSPRILISPRRLLAAGYEWKHVGDDWVDKRKKNHRTGVSSTRLKSRDTPRLSDACLL